MTDRSQTTYPVHQTIFRLTDGKMGVLHLPKELNATDLQLIKNQLSMLEIAVTTPVEESLSEINRRMLSR